MSNQDPHAEKGKASFDAEQALGGGVEADTLQEISGATVEARNPDGEIPVVNAVGQTATQTARDAHSQQPGKASTEAQSSGWPKQQATGADGAWDKLKSTAPAQHHCPLLAYGGFPVQKSWRKRHPVLFWLGVLAVLVLVYSIGVQAGGNGMVLGPKIGIVVVDEAIMDAKPVLEWIEKLRHDQEVEGVILRVDTPGGAVAPSQEIYAALRELRKTKPVIVSMGGLATSGGYYISMGGDTIFAMPSTLTANIGVRMEVPNFEKLFDTIGVGTTVLKTGEYKDAGSSSREMTPEERAYLQALLDDMHSQFVEAIAEGREMPIEKVKALADGRAMTGRQALEAGLVDYIGNLQDAKEFMIKRCKEAGLGDSFNFVEGPAKPEEPWRDMLGVLFDLSVKHSRSQDQARFYY